MSVKHVDLRGRVRSHSLFHSGNVNVAAMLIPVEVRNSSAMDSRSVILHGLPLCGRSFCCSLTLPLSNNIT